MTRTDKLKLIPYLDFLKKELLFVSEYKRQVDWKVYQTQRSKRLEIERWVESLINATLDISKVLLTVMANEIPETSRELLFQIGSNIYGKEEKAESFSELAKIRNTLAHRYLDVRWEDIKRFLNIVPEFYPPFIEFVEKMIEE